MTPNGEFTEFPIPTANSGPSGITAGPDGDLWFTETSAGKIGRITTAGVMTEFALPSAKSEPMGIAAGPDGALWFTETFGNAIGRITTAGQISEFPLPNEVSRPTGIAAGPDGNLWFTEEQGSRIGRLDATGQIDEFAVPTGVRSGIAAGPDGGVWFTGRDGIGRIAPTGQIVEFPAGEEGLRDSGGIAAGPDGNLWFTEEATNTVSRITTGGTVTEFRIPQPFPETASPMAITSGPGGYLWFTESAANKIGRLDPGGAIPQDATPPFITGKVRLGSKLTAHPGTWANSPSRYFFLWQDCDRSGGSCTEVTTGAKHRVTDRDIGRTIRVFVIGRNLGGSSAPAESRPTALVLGPAKHLFLGGSTQRLSIMGSDGYRISLSTYVNHRYHRATLEAEKAGAYARYAVKAVAHDGAVRAVYPGLGRIVAHFFPTKVRELAPHRGCRKPSGVIEAGTYVGAIRFRGERGFTKVNASRAHGTVVKRFRQLCRVVNRGTRMTELLPSRHFEEIDLDAHAGSVRFTASNLVGHSTSQFNVTAAESRRGMHIARGIHEVVDTDAFSYSSAITEATVAPPPPIKGRATYAGSADPDSPMPSFYTQGTLVGSLRVFLPGLGVVGLASDGTQASMGRSAGVSE